MSWLKSALGNVAPAKPIKLNSVSQNEKIWQVTLDHIESGTGRLLERVVKPLADAGSSTHAFDQRHVLYSKLRPYLNKVLLPDSVGIGTTELVPMLPDPERLDRDYLAHYLKSKLFVNWVSNQTAGAKMPRVSMGTFWEHEIPLPPLPEQKRIAAILDKSDSLRRKNQQAIQLADQFLRALFLDMFGDPVTNPKGWDIKPLKDQIVHANNGLSRRRKETENEGDIVLRLQDIQYEGIQFEKGLNRIMLDDKESLRYKVDVDDILFIRVNGNPDYIGRSAVFKGYKEAVYHNDHLIRIKTGEAYNAEFLSYCLNFKGSRKIISIQIKTSAGQYTISQGGIEKLEFFRPPIELQNKFIAIRNHALNIPHHKIDDGSLFNALSQKAFAGQL